MWEGGRRRHKGEMGNLVVKRGGRGGGRRGRRGRGKEDDKEHNDIDDKEGRKDKKEKERRSWIRMMRRGGRERKKKA